MSGPWKERSDWWWDAIAIPTRGWD